jgi:hypothetical protein
MTADMLHQVVSAAARSWRVIPFNLPYKTRLVGQRRACRSQAMRGTLGRTREYVLTLGPLSLLLTAAQHFVTDLLFNSAQLKFSRAQKRAVMDWAKALGADPPSLYSLSNLQKRMLSDLGNPEREQRTGSGSIWYLNTVRDALIKVSAYFMCEMSNLTQR